MHERKNNDKYLDRPNLSKSDVVIIGGGAAGFFAAIAAKENRPDFNVTLLEATRSVLTKVKISGGGRCNVTHACYDPKTLLDHYPRGHRKLEHNFRRFGPTEVIKWFESRGISLKTEGDGRVFPTSDRSEDIVNCLRHEASKLGIVVQTHAPVSEVVSQAGGFKVCIRGESTPIQAQYLVMATGGASGGYQLLKSLGHQLLPATPSLFTFCVADPDLTALTGVSVPHVTGKLTFPNAKPVIQSGPLLITHWGVSGPCILKLSAWGARELAKANYQTQLLVDWVPDHSAEALRQEIRSLKATHAQKQLKNLPSLLPIRLWCYLLNKAGFDMDQKVATIKDKPLNVFSEQLKRWPIKVTGKGPFKEEFVTAGGVPLNEIHLNTYESKVAPNLYVVGELLNIDGVTGGFNFQNAWTSGYIAGCAIATR